MTDDSPGSELVAAEQPQASAPDAQAGTGAEIESLRARLADAERSAQRRASEIGLLRGALRDSAQAALARREEIAMLRAAVIAGADAALDPRAEADLLHEALVTQVTAAGKLQAQIDELHAALAAMTELVEQEGVHSSVLADVVRAETGRREDLAAELAGVREQLEALEQVDAARGARMQRLETRLEQLVGELAFVGAARADAEQTVADLMAAALVQQHSEHDLGTPYTTP